MNAKTTPALFSVVRHVHWTDATGQPCQARIIQNLGAGRVLVEFVTLPPRAVMPRRMALSLDALRAEVSNA